MSLKRFRRIKTKTFQQAKRGEAVFIDLESVSIPTRCDFERRNDNVKMGRALCHRCNGTGKRHLGMSSSTCPDCYGLGFTTEEK